MSQEALLGLWRRYHDTGDIRARDRLVFSLAPIVKCIVYRKIREIPAYHEVDDFISCGLEALIRSLDRYDPDQGAALDDARSLDWAPRSLRRMEREYNRTRERFTVLHGRAPSRSELAELLAISEQELCTLMDDIARSDIGSLNTLVISEDDRPPEERKNTPSTTSPAMRTRAYRESVRALPPPRRFSRSPSPGRASRAAARLKPHAARDRRDPRRLREPRLPDPRQAQARPARAPGGGRDAVPRTRLSGAWEHSSRPVPSSPRTSQRISS